MRRDERGQQVTLNAFEQRLAEALTRERQKRNAGVGVTDRKVDPSRDGSSVALDGCGAELAFCRLFNVYPNLTTHPRRGEDDCDVVLPNGVTVDVKVSKRGDIHIVSWKGTKGEEYFAGFRGRFPNYWFCGFYPRERALQPERFDRSMPRPCYRVPVEDLQMETPES